MTLNSDVVNEVWLFLLVQADGDLWNLTFVVVSEVLLLFASYLAGRSCKY